MLKGHFFLIIEKWLLVKVMVMCHKDVKKNSYKQFMTCFWGDSMWSKKHHMVLYALHTCTCANIGFYLHFYKSKLSIIRATINVKKEFRMLCLILMLIFITMKYMFKSLVKLFLQLIKNTQKDKQILIRN